MEMWDESYSYFCYIRRFFNTNEHQYVRKGHEGTIVRNIGIA